MSKNESDRITVASSPCMLHDLREGRAPGIDAGQARDVARWRKAERERLIAARISLAGQYRADQAVIIAQRLEQIVATSGIAAPVVSVYWPIRAEPDLRPWMNALCLSGTRVALPVALALSQPLIFREWRPRGRMARGLWNIPYPADGEILLPSIVVAPVVGFDPECYRLGYGGGFFDRTLGALTPKPLAIGVGYPEAELRSIFPQPHDIPMDWMVTGSGSKFHAEAGVE